MSKHTVSNSIVVSNVNDRLSAGEPEDIAPQYDILLEQDADGLWAANPAILKVASGFGTERVSYVKWYVVPQPNLNASAAFATDGILFQAPPAGMTVSYDSDRVTASVNWADHQTGVAVLFTYTFTLNVTDNEGVTNTVTVDPTVVNEPPGPGFIEEAAPEQATA